VIDGAGDSVLGTVTVGEQPCAFCVNTQDSKVYCANSGEFPFDYDSSVTVIDGGTHQAIATVIVGYNPRALCYNPADNRTYSANWESDNVTVIDGATDSVISTVAAGHGPTALLYNPLSNKVYCANEGDSVTVIRGSTNQALLNVGVGDWPMALCHNPMQNRVYVANFGSSTISVIRDSMTGIEESPKPQASSHKPAATVVRSLPAGAVAFDAMGRRVVEPRPGVYFVVTPHRDPLPQGERGRSTRPTVSVRKVVQR
jgi:YVTN family beta-propeller protein